VTDQPSADVWGRQEVTPDAVVTRIGGQVDHATITAFTEHLRAAEAAATPPTPVVLDLTDVDFFGSGGLAALVELNLRCTQAGRPLRIIADQRAVTRPIALTGLHASLDVVPTLQQAIGRS
jgi:anti-sigma B factor antagonist